MKSYFLFVLFFYCNVIQSAHEANNKKYVKIKAHKAPVSGLTFLDSETLATSCLDGTSKLVHLKKKKLETIMSLEKHLFAFAHSHNTLAYRTAKYLILYNTLTQEEFYKYGMHKLNNSWLR